MVSQPQGKPRKVEASPLLPPQGVWYLTLRSLHPLRLDDIAFPLDGVVCFLDGTEFFCGECREFFGQPFRCNRIGMKFNTEFPISLLDFLDRSSRLQSEYRIGF